MTSLKNPFKEIIDSSDHIAVDFPTHLRLTADFHIKVAEQMALDEERTLAILLNLCLEEEKREDPDYNGLVIAYINARLAILKQYKAGVMAESDMLDIATSKVGIH